jgi:formylglycine-generating enzyme required for sulfatase activity
MMQDKVRLSLFEKFAASAEVKKQPLENDDWKKIAKNPNPKGADPIVTAVIWPDARRCAKWLGGELPLRRQWDKVAGFYGKRPAGFEKKEIQGPFDGIHDLTGNGREWTDSQTDDQEENHPGLMPKLGGQFVVVRGQRTEEELVPPQPMHYEDLRDRGKWYREFPTQPRPDIGFRVVLEPVVLEP